MWEGICLDLDIAVQGNSLEQVVISMRGALHAYLAYVSTLPPQDQQRLLNRRAPLQLRLKFAWCMVRALVGGRRGDGDGGKERADFTLNAAMA